MNADHAFMYRTRQWVYRSWFVNRKSATRQHIITFPSPSPSAVTLKRILSLYVCDSSGAYIEDRRYDAGAAELAVGRGKLQHPDNSVPSPETIAECTIFKTREESTGSAQAVLLNGLLSCSWHGSGIQSTV